MLSIYFTNNNSLKRFKMSESTPTAEAQGVNQEQGTQPDTNVQDAIPRSRLNEVIAQKRELEGKLTEMQSMIEEKQRAELEEQGKIAEVNTQLKSEIKDLKQYKKMFEEQDSKIRTDALNKLPEDKQDKFKELKTKHLLDVGEEITGNVKANPPDDVGKVKKELPEGNIFGMESSKRKGIWRDYLASKQN